MTLRVFKDLDSTMKDFVGVHMLMPQKSTSALTRFLHGNLRAKVYLSGSTEVAQLFLVGALGLVATPTVSSTLREAV